MSTVFAVVAIIVIVILNLTIKGDGTMSKKKNLFSVLLAVMIVLSMTVTAFAATDLKSQVNAIKLDPFTESWIGGTTSPDMIQYGKTILNRNANTIKGKKTNYDKLVAVFNAVSNDSVLGKQRKTTQNCAVYSRELYEQLTIAGFMPYLFEGNITAANGGKTYHNWNGIDIGGKLYYLDAYMTAGGSKNYFLIPQSSATMYSDINIFQMDVGWGFWGKVGPLSQYNTAEKRKAFAPLRDINLDRDAALSMYSDPWLYYAPFGPLGYNEQTDKQGRAVTYYSDGTMLIETQAERQARKDRLTTADQQARQDAVDREYQENLRAWEEENARIRQESEARYQAALDEANKNIEAYEPGKVYEQHAMRLTTGGVSDTEFHEGNINTCPICVENDRIFFESLGLAS